FVVFYYPLYPLLLVIKKSVTGIEARSALIDSIFLLPCHLLLSHALGQPLDRDADFLGLALPLMIGTVRIGCLLGGCCYGRFSRWGVLYQRDLLVPRRTGWRTYTPGPHPGHRVFPCQLLDAAFNLVAFAALSAITLAGPASAPPSLILYIVAYSAYRLVTDPLRGHRHQRQHRSLSTTQWVAVVALLLIPYWALVC
ncbi:prolipoprotein diacylglyceryl transferase family protein, partial [Streptomyces sp. NPDC085932]|uniref:prolipoprotein diacylglyceryl transferase family protein n=1 Tax=Streptomyces sp. NPDC085932 TaxID=3365741 RepID=UPI0037D1B8C6